MPLSHPVLKRAAAHSAAASLLAMAMVQATVAFAQPAATPAAPPQGEIKGTAVVHTAESAQAAVAQAALVLPARLTGGAVYAGPFRDAPATQGSAPVVVFLHGSSGLGLAAIGEWQKWLAAQGIASIAPDSFALPDRLTYKSPVDKATYEKIHALRGSEIEAALAALRSAPWADRTRLVLAGTSEGAPAVARASDEAFAGRMLFAWSCEDNYFVERHATLAGSKPVLNVISAQDPYFSRSNAWLGGPAAAQGHCAAALKANPRSSVVLLPDAPHTLLNLPAARQVVSGFLREVVGP